MRRRQTLLDHPQNGWGVHVDALRRDHRERELALGGRVGKRLTPWLRMHLASGYGLIATVRMCTNPSPITPFAYSGDHNSSNWPWTTFLMNLPLTNK